MRAIRAPKRVTVVLRKVSVIDNVAVGGMAKYLRQEAKVPLGTVAALMGKSSPYLSELEHGTANWTEKLVNDFHAALQRAKQRKHLPAGKQGRRARSASRS